MYDLQIIVPCVEHRLVLFQILGLHNIKNNKVLVYCLVENKNNFIQGWPEGIDLEIIENRNKNENFRLFDFLYNLSLEKASQAKWTLKIDDDSYNNIDYMCASLNARFDYQEDHYLVGSPIRGENSYHEVNVLKKLDLWDKIENNWKHELECCILSQGAFKKIISNEDCKRIFSGFSEINKKDRLGHTDQLIGAAAKLCNIHPTEDKKIHYQGKQINKNDLENYYHFHRMDFDSFISIGKKLNRNFKIKIEENSNKLF